MITKIWNWVKDKAQYLSTFQPAQLRGIYVAVVALLATVGISVSAKVDSEVEAVIGFLVVVVPLLQGLWTARSVVPLEVHKAAVDKALWTPPPAAATDTAIAAGDALAAAITGAPTTEVAPGAQDAPEAPGSPAPAGTVQDPGTDAP